MKAGAPPGTALCRLDEIPDGAGRGFVFGRGLERWAVFAVRRGEAVFAYVNSCPHAGTPLDWPPDRFFNFEGTLLRCGTHGARFRVEDGYCVSGPCAGKSLVPVAVELVDGVLRLAE